MTETARIQYVFLDVVGFTRNRSVEAQSDVVETLNSIVTSSLLELEIPGENTVLLPTGDGMAIAMIEVAGVDVHLRLALHLLGAVAQHNSGTEDPMRRFDVRIGINENIDNVLNDINGRRNVAGAGISMAQRIMDKADGGQVLVGATVYETLRQREQYMSTWRAFTAKGKHDITFPVYQYVAKDAPGLNVAVPSVFSPRRREPEKLSLFAAYYLAHAIVNRDFLSSRRSDPTRDYAATILLAFLAEDSATAAETPPHDEPTAITWKAGIATFEEQYHHYKELEFWLLARFADLIQEKRLSRFFQLFEEANYATFYWLVSPSGIEKLLAEWSEVAGEFGIESAK
jgi:class 3 adenylate cyclase